MPNTEQIPYQTDKSSYRRCSIKKAVLKNSQILTGKHLCWNLFFKKLQTFRTATLLKRDSNTDIYLFRNFGDGLDCRFQNHLDSVILQK